MFNSHELRQYITGPLSADNIQQCGIDLNLIRVEQVSSEREIGIIPYEGKTTLADRSLVFLNEAGFWRLEPGVYDVTFAQGCKIPDNIVMLIRQRSSLLRNGSLLHSSVFDPGFQTDNIGTILHVRTPILIQENARIAQIYGHWCTPVPKENLYNGQWQGDAQRA